MTLSIVEGSGSKTGRGLDRWNGVNRNRAKACTDLRLSCQLSGAVRMEVWKVVFRLFEVSYFSFCKI